MKRALLIAGGTVGGLGAVLSITPPQLNSQSAMAGLSTMATAAATTAAPVAQTTTAQTMTAPAAATPSTTAATPKATTAKKKKATKRKVAAAKSATKTSTTSSATAPTTSAPAAPTATATTPAATTSTPVPVKSTPAAAPAPKGVSGTFNGSVVNVNYGNVQVQITVVDGKITNAQALQAPSGGRSGSISQQVIPMLRQQTLTAQSSAIQGVGGASYTSYGWYTSLQSALGKAGLPL